MNLNATRATIEARPEPTPAEYAAAEALIARRAPELLDMLFAPIGGTA